ncbi:MAG: CvpA family protein [Oscillospiraceae bacterium]
MPYLIFDVAIVALLVLFALWGAKRGFILSLCGLVAVVVAVVGAAMLSHFLTPLIAQWLTPHLTPLFEGWLVQEGVPQQTGFLWRMMEEALRSNLPAAAEALPEVTTAAALAVTVAGWIANATSFFLTFLAILLAWTVLSHALDLVSKLPGLNLLNKTAGLLIGLVKGGIFLFVGAWVLGQFNGLITPEMMEKAPLFRFLMTTDPLSLLMKL